MVGGLLEGVGRQTIFDDGLRALIGLAVLAGWLLPKRGHAAPAAIEAETPPAPVHA